MSYALDMCCGKWKATQGRESKVLSMKIFVRSGWKDKFLSFDWIPFFILSPKGLLGYFTDKYPINILK
jgi:hypothetical protein